jgi:hypothetical protein
MRQTGAQASMIIEYTLDPEDVASARLLAIGIRPRLELGAFAAVISGLLGWSVSPWSYDMLPLIIGLTACLGGFRLMQIAKVRQAAAAAFQRNATLRRLTTAAWDDGGVTIHPLGANSERILWSEVAALKENERIVLLQQSTGNIHAIPKRALADKSMLGGFRALARAGIKRR